MNPGLDHHEQAIICSILNLFPDIEQATLYGSRAKGTHNERSDIDLALTGSNLDRHTINRVKLELDDSELLYPVDLLDYQSINNPQLKSHVDRLGIVIYRK